MNTAIFLISIAIALSGVGFLAYGTEKKQKK